MKTTLRPYLDYKDCGLPWLGRIPDHWQVRRNGYLFTQRNETGYGELPILEVSLKTGVRVREFNGSSRKQVMSDRDKYKRAVRGDITYNMMRLWQGAVGVAPTDGLVSPAYVVASPYPSTVSSYFIEVFRTDACKTEINKYSRGIVTDRNRLYWDEFKQMPVCVPPTEEQAGIVRYLNHTDQKIRQFIQAKRRLIGLLNEQRQSLATNIILGNNETKTEHQWSNDGRSQPLNEGWEHWQLGHFARIGNGSTPSRGRPDYWIGGMYPWLNSSSVNQVAITKSDQFVTDRALKECHLPIVLPESVLVAITGQGKTRGTSALLTFEATINQHLAYITIKKPVMTPNYLHLVLTGMYRTLRAMSDGSGSTKGALTCHQLRHLTVPVPPLAQQSQIIQRVSSETEEIEATLRKAQSAIRLMEEYRTRLIADVVTGKLDVREAAERLPSSAEQDFLDDEFLDLSALDSEEAEGLDDESELLPVAADEE